MSVRREIVSVTVDPSRTVWSKEDTGWVNRGAVLVLLVREHDYDYSDHPSTLVELHWPHMDDTTGGHESEIEHLDMVRNRTAPIGWLPTGQRPVDGPNGAAG